MNLIAGDRVRITSALGFLGDTNFHHPGHPSPVVALSDSVGRWNYGRIPQGKPFQKPRSGDRLLWWESTERAFIQILSFPSWRILQEGGKDGWIR